MFEYCIIGGGPAGLILANALRQRVSAENIVIFEAGGDKEANDEAAKFISKGSTEYKPIRRFMLGGHGHLWGGACPRLHPDDFRMRTEYGIHIDWPITYTELEPYYRRAEEMLSVGPVGVGFSSDTANDPIAKRLKSSGYNGAIPYGNRLFFVDQLLPALQKSGVDIRLHNVVRRINETDEGSAEIVYHDPKLDVIQHLDARYVILCCGGLSNARILQLSKTKRFPTGIGNHAGHLGHYHMDHPRVIAAIERDYSPKQENLKKKGSLPFTLVKAVDKEHPNIAFASISISRENSVSLARTELEATLNELDSASALQSNLDSLLKVSERVIFDLETMDPPGFENVLELADQVDVYGDPMLATNININTERAHVDNATLSLLDYIFSEAGYRLVFLRKSGWTGQHPSGSTRMATRKEDGVVDNNLRVYGTHSIYVLGSSVFPTVGYANPTLTIVSLALRLADHFLGNE